MGFHKNASIRFQVLDRCLRNPGKRYYWQDLLEEVNKKLMEIDPDSGGVERRTLYDDLRFMESSEGWSAPIERIPDGRRKYYQYADLNFSINNQPLNESELNQIRSAIEVLSRFRGLPQFDWVSELIPTMETKLGLVEAGHQIISIDSNPEYSGLKWLAPLFEAIYQKEVLTIIYQDFKTNSPQEFTYHPYHLRQFNNRWFVFGLNQKQDMPSWNLPLDRIIDISKSDEKYIETEIDWEEDFFFDIVGVSRPLGKLPELIRLKVNSSAAPYVKTKPIHHTQKIKKEDTNGIELTIMVIPNYELKSLILGFGQQVEVLEPMHFRQTIIEAIREMARTYGRR